VNCELAEPPTELEEAPGRTPAELEERPGRTATELEESSGRTTAELEEIPGRTAIELEDKSPTCITELDDSATGSVATELEDTVAAGLGGAAKFTSSSEQAEKNATAAIGIRIFFIVDLLISFPIR
jgi:hypothetical protein